MLCEISLLKSHTMKKVSKGTLPLFHFTLKEWKISIFNFSFILCYSIQDRKKKSNIQSFPFYQMLQFPTIEIKVSMGVLWGNFKILVTKIGLDFGTALNPPYLCTSIMPELKWRQSKYD